jgi:hypothetical protein
MEDVKRIVKANIKDIRKNVKASVEDIKMIVNRFIIMFIFEHYVVFA